MSMTKKERNSQLTLRCRLAPPFPRPLPPLPRPDIVLVKELSGVGLLVESCCERWREEDESKFKIQSVFIILGSPIGGGMCRGLWTVSYKEMARGINYASVTRNSITTKLREVLV